MGESDDVTQGRLAQNGEGVIQGLVTHDRFLGGGVSVIQPAKGYRAGMDCVLLAASLSANAKDHLAEAGCGAGGALLCAAHRLSFSRFTGFEREAEAVHLANAGVEANQMADRLAIRTADIAERPPELENAFAQAFANPPYYSPGAVRRPAKGKDAAFMAETPLRDWILFLLHVTAPGGRITLIHRAGALADLLDLLGPRTGEIEILPVRPAPNRPANRVLIRARKGLRRGPVTLYDGLALYDIPGGPVSQKAEACFLGGALEWR